MQVYIAYSLISLIAITIAFVMCLSIGFLMYLLDQDIGGYICDKIAPIFMYMAGFNVVIFISFVGVQAINYLILNIN